MNENKIHEVEIKNVLFIYEKASNLEFLVLNQILQTEYVSKEVANFMLKKIIQNLNTFSDDALTTIKLLLTFGASFEELEDSTTGMTALMISCQKGFDKLSEFIIKECPNELNKTNKHKKNCLYFAVQSPDTKNKLDMINNLLRQGVNINLRENFSGDSCLSLAIRQGNLPIAALLLQYGADSNIKTGSQNETPLHVACKNLNNDLMNLLLINKSNPYEVDSFNKTGLDYLIEKQKEIMSLCDNENYLNDLSVCQNMIDQYKKIIDRSNRNDNINDNINDDNNNLESSGKVPDININTDLNSKPNNNPDDEIYENQEKNINDLDLDDDECSRDYYEEDRNQENNNTKQDCNEKNNICIRQIRNELSVYSSKDSNNNQKPINQMQNKSEYNTASNLNTLNEYSPIMINTQSQSKEVLNLPLHICPNFKEISIDSNKDISISIDLNSTLISEIDQLRAENLTLTKQSSVQHSSIIELFKNSRQLSEAVEIYKSELNLLMEAKKANDEKMNLLLYQLKEKDELLRQSELKINEMAKKNIYLIDLKSKLESELKEVSESKQSNIDRMTYLQLKFSNSKMEDKDILRNLNNDIIDFMEYNREIIKTNKPVLEQLIIKLKQIVFSLFNDTMDLILYGSYSTNLCLAWSDIDLVLINKNGDPVNDSKYLKNLISIIQTQSWKKSCILIENTSVPLIKIISSDTFLNYYIDISLQDGKHLGIKCVTLIKLYLKEYEVLEPLIISLKNLLKCAGLNDPYKGGLSSYGLILLVVSFLQSQQDQGKSISKENHNIGRLFMEILYYYGAYFDQSKYIIYTQIPNEPKDINFQVSKLSIFLYI